MKKNRSLTVANSIIEACYFCTSTELKLLAAVISCINRTDDDFREYTFSMYELADRIGIDKRNAAAQIIPAARSLRKMDVVIKENDITIETTFFTSTAIYDNDGDMLSFTFLPKLKKYLLQLKSCFTTLNLSIIINFKSVYSIRIYFLLKQYQPIGKRRIGFLKLKEMLCIEDKYKLFSDFRRFVLEASKKEFEMIIDGRIKSDITFDFELTRKGRAVYEILFIIKDNPYSNERTLSSQSIAEENPEDLDKKLFNEFIEHVKINDPFIYEFYSQHGRNAHMVQGYYHKFIDKWLKDKEK